MPDAGYKFRAKVLVYPGMSAWRFASIPKTISKKIKQSFEGLERGWGSFPVNATIGKTRWKTSIFPDKKSGTYLLPLKAQVRKAENIKDNQTISITIEILT